MTDQANFETCSDPRWWRSGGIELVHVKLRENCRGVMLCSGLTFLSMSLTQSFVPWSAEGSIQTQKSAAGVSQAATCAITSPFSILLLITCLWKKYFEGGCTENADSPKRCNLLCFPFVATYPHIKMMPTCFQLKLYVGFWLSVWLTKLWHLGNLNASVTGYYTRTRYPSSVYTQMPL